MLLAVDIGNTNIKFGVYDAEDLRAKLSVPTIRDISAAGLAKVVGSRVTHTISTAIVSSVVPEVDAAVREFINSSF
ncbi:MAG TPA: type III pantothenate kinase, partial [Candidatus Ozemobacteraceae bacterium]|nr:type III pantothenate kinase [Candidatus Ozemobacteraceae bacterium]